jgi:hypothetical protein
MESGWSESYNRLLDDMNMLLVGGDGAIQVVVTINWTLNRHTRLVRGFVESYVRDRNGMPVLRQREQIVPIPRQTSTPQRLEFSRREVFGASLLPVLPQAKFYQAIDDLRSVAANALLLMNLGPA